MLKIEEFKKKSKVVSPIGGAAQRFLPSEIAYTLRKKLGEDLLKKIYTPKPLVEVRGKKLVERFIEPYKRFGINEFVFLIGRGGEEVQDFLGDGEKFGIEARYSIDPNVEKVGKGKALKNAYLNGVLDKNEEAYLHWGFPDDLILYPYFVEESSYRFLYYKEIYDIYGLVIVAPYTTYPFGVIKSKNRRAISFKEKPIIKIATNTGRGIFDSQKLWPYLEAIDINYPEAIELEDTVLPKLAKEGKLSYCELPRGEDWIPINTLKDLIKAENSLQG